MIFISSHPNQEFGIFGGEFWGFRILILQD